MNKDVSKLKRELREAVANYMRSEGCSCCRDYEAHKEHEATLAKLLNVKKYNDNSGYYFSKYQSKPTSSHPKK